MATILRLFLGEVKKVTRILDAAPGETGSATVLTNALRSGLSFMTSAGASHN